MAPRSDPSGRPLVGFDAATYGDRFVDVYDDWYADVTDTVACVTSVAALACDVASNNPDGNNPGSNSSEARVLEMGVGTGRLAIPLAETGVTVVGLDASVAMLTAMAARPGGELVRAVHGDMADPPLDGETFHIVLVAFNTLFNLTDPQAQRLCLERSAALLTPGGRIVVEAFVPDPDATSGDTVDVRQVTADRVVLSVSRTDASAQLVVGQYVDITESGVKLRPWQVRWSSPDQLDSLAERAGLVLEDRWSDWDHNRYTEDAHSHVSVYRRA